MQAKYIARSAGLPSGLNNYFGEVEKAKDWLFMD